MRMFRRRQLTASREPEAADPVAGRGLRYVDDATGLICPCTPPPGSPAIRHSDALRYGAAPLGQAEFGRTHG